MTDGAPGPHATRPHDVDAPRPAPPEDARGPRRARETAGIGRRRGPRWAWTAVDGARARQRRLEAWVERRYPALYDGRHAAAGIGRLLWPLIGPLLAALVLLPVVAVLAGLVYALLALLGALGVEPPRVDVPTIPLPDVSAPGWLRWLGDAVSDVLDVLGPIARVLVVGGAVVYGIHRTWSARRTRREAEALGRTELVRRLGVALAATEERARAAGATTVGDAGAREA